MVLNLSSFADRWGEGEGGEVMVLGNRQVGALTRAAFTQAAGTLARVKFHLCPPFTKTELHAHARVPAARANGVARTRFTTLRGPEVEGTPDLEEGHA